MFLKRILTLSAAAFLALLLLAAVALWLGSRTGAARRAVAAELSGIAGLPVTLAAFSVGFLPTPAVSLGGLSVSQPAGFDGAPLAEIGEARIALSWSALAGSGSLRRIQVDAPVLRPRRGADGSDNWTAVIDRLAELGGGEETHWRIGRLEIARGAIEFADDVAGLRLRLSGFAVEADAVEPATVFPLALRVGGEAGERTFHFSMQAAARLDPAIGHYQLTDLVWRGWAGGAPLPLSGLELEGGARRASLDRSQQSFTVEHGRIAAGGAALGYHLRSERLETAPVTSFSASAAAFDPRMLARALGRLLPATRDPAALGSLEFVAGGRLDGDGLTVGHLEGRLDGAAFTGSVLPGFRLRLAIDSLDADRYLAPETAAPDPEATLEEALGNVAALDLDAELRIGRATAGNAVLEDVLLRIEPEEAAP